MSARLYRVVSTVLRDGYKRAFIREWLVSAPNRQKAVKMVKERTYTMYSDHDTYTCECIGGGMKSIQERVLKESQ